MNQTQILLAGFLIVLFASLAFNINHITGFTVKRSDGAMAISPTAIRLYSDGKDVVIRIRPGEEGVSRYVFVQDINGKTIGRAEVCSDEHRCYDDVDVTYHFPYSAEDGVYYLNVYDYGSGSMLEGRVSISH